MAKIWLDHEDGRYSARLLTEAEAADRAADVAYIEDGAWAAYLRHCDRDATWQVLWRAISNEQYMRRRELELMPLEEAEREIARLKEDLARSKRMEKFYVEQYTQQLSEKHRREHFQWSCVFPQPGCDVDVLPAKWREDASQILEYQHEMLAAEGPTVQRCCCGDDHVKLDEATVQQLRLKGFVVEP